ncbi:protein NATD1 isoform X2 [Nothobranchius furzeri]|uniref:Protein NATD1 n=1 Tax=Nothobranchius furzeri TaxID=105023 RepID=A0A8C6VYU9_NOTFU|nr:protein NATD1 [Nothobranchius furzeri]KAF7227415.1 protein NATD1-like [Nothobranchius furzeri]
MAFKSTSKLLELTQRSWSWQKSFCSLGYSGSFTVEHDRLNRCFTVSPVSSGEGVNSIPDFKPGSRIDSSAARQQAVLYYRFTGDKQVDLMSTFVPETFRGQRIAALLSQAAIDFLLENKLKAHVSCWYIKKYIAEHPHQQYKDLIIS